MQTVLVVEDEKLIRQGLSAMIKRCGVPVGEVIECANGIKAMEVLREKNVDVMFTDIRMPKMNGIELVKAMQELDNLPITIAVSGYDDFSYAVEMMRQGVREYILKPVERDKLKEVMEKLEDEISRKLITEKTTQKLGRKFLKYLLTDEEENREVLNVLEKRIKAEAGDEFWVLVSVKEDEINDELKDLSPLSEIGSTQVFILGKDMVEKLRCKTSDEECGIISTAGISDGYSDAGNLKKAYLQAKCRREKAFFKGSLVMDANAEGSVPEKLLENGRKLCEKTAVDARVHLIGTNNREQLEKEWEGFFTAAERGQIEADDFAGSIVLFAEEFGKVYKRDFPSELGDPFAFSSLFEYKEAFMETVNQESSRFTKESGEGINDRKMIKAVAYIKENYHSDINMAVVSNYVSMNYSLFSAEFKNYTGTNFVTYIRELRINEAKKLLSDTQYKVNEIGSMVGYDNDKQFMKSFKAMMGVSPSQYRRNVME